MKNQSKYTTWKRLIATLLSLVLVTSGVFWPFGVQPAQAADFSQVRPTTYLIDDLKDFELKIGGQTYSKSSGTGSYGEEDDYWVKITNGELQVYTKCLPYETWENGATETTAEGDTAYVYDKVANAPDITITFPGAAHDADDNAYDVVVEIDKFQFTRPEWVSYDGGTSNSRNLGLTEYRRYVLGIDWHAVNGPNSRLFFRNWVRARDGDTSYGTNNISILGNGSSGTYTDAKIYIKDAPAGSTYLFSVGDLDVARRTQPDGSTAMVYVPGAEGVVLKDGFDLSTLMMADNTRLKTYKLESGSWTQVSEPGDADPGWVYTYGNYIIGSADTPDADTNAQKRSRLYLSAAATGSSFTWTSGINCNTQFLEVSANSVVKSSAVIVKKTTNDTSSEAFPFRVKAWKEVKTTLAPNSTPLIGTLTMERPAGKRFELWQFETENIPFIIQNTYGYSLAYETSKTYQAGDPAGGLGRPAGLSDNVGYFDEANGITAQEYPYHDQQVVPFVRLLWSRGEQFQGTDTFSLSTVSPVNTGKMVRIGDRSCRLRALGSTSASKCSVYLYAFVSSAISLTTTEYLNLTGTDGFTAVSGEEGVYQFNVTANDASGVSIKIPEGYNYEIWEETPSGWTLASVDGDSAKTRATGVTAEGNTARHIFHNTKTATTIPVYVKLGANKTMDGGQPAGTFNFALTAKTAGAPAGGTASNTSTGAITFPNLKFDAAGTYEYTLTETAGSDSTINYDTTQHTVRIVVTDSTSDQNLTAAVYVDDALKTTVTSAQTTSTTAPYDALANLATINSGVTFANTTKTPTTVTVKKTTDNTSDSDAFPFRVKAWKEVQGTTTGPSNYVQIGTLSMTRPFNALNPPGFERWDFETRNTAFSINAYGHNVACETQKTYMYGDPDPMGGVGRPDGLARNIGYFNESDENQYHDEQVIPFVRLFWTRDNLYQGCDGFTLSPRIASGYTDTGKTVTISGQSYTLYAVGSTSESTGYVDLYVNMAAPSSSGTTTEYLDLSGVSGFSAVSGEEGTYEFNVTADDANGVTINIPEGYSYEIWEETPSGWTLVSVDGDSAKTSATGEVTSGYAASHSFHNTKDQTPTAPITVTKTTDDTGDSNAFPFKVKAWKETVANGTCIKIANFNWYVDPDSVYFNLTTVADFSFNYHNYDLAYPNDGNYTVRGNYNSYPPSSSDQIMQFFYLLYTRNPVRPYDGDYAGGDGFSLETDPGYANIGYVDTHKTVMVNNSNYKLLATMVNSGISTEGTASIDLYGVPTASITTEYLDLSGVSGFTAVSGEEGVYEFDVTANDGSGVTINIPEGYSYEIWEETPGGWTLASVDGDSAKIRATGEVTSGYAASHNFYNRKNTPRVAPITVTKTTDNASDSDAFPFKMKAWKETPASSTYLPVAYFYYYWDTDQSNIQLNIHEDFSLDPYGYTSGEEFIGGYTGNNTREQMINSIAQKAQLFYHMAENDTYSHWDINQYLDAGSTITINNTSYDLVIYYISKDDGMMAEANFYAEIPPASPTITEYLDLSGNSGFTAVSGEEGVYQFNVTANDANGVTVDILKGYKYEIWEETPSGWTLAGVDGDSAKIKATGVAYTNRAVSHSFRNTKEQMAALTGTAKETYGLKGALQTVADAKSMFSSADSSVTISKAELVDASGSVVTSLEVKDKADSSVTAGTYSIDNNGKITFTPETGYLGDPEPVTVKGTASNGQTATATYTPHVKWQEENKTVTRTIEYKYKSDNSTAAPTVTQEVSFTRTPASINERGEITMGAWTPANGQWAKVDSPTITNYTPDQASVAAETVTASTENETVTVYYANTAALTGTAKETYGLKGAPQTVADAKSMFSSADSSVTISKAELVDASGSVVTSLTVKDSADSSKTAGTYIIDASGKITFTPETGYLGDPEPVTVKGTASNGQTATATYTPHVKWQEENKTVTRTIEYKYKKDGSEASATVTQTARFTRIPALIDENTGVIAMGDWKPENPDPEDNTKGLWAEQASPELASYIVDHVKKAKRSVSATDSDVTETVYYYGAAAEKISTEGYVNRKQDPKRTLKSLFQLDDGLTIEKFVILQPGTDPANPTEIEVSATDPTILPVMDSRDNTKPAGEYRIDPTTGAISFMPATGYTGTPQPLPVRAKVQVKEGATVLNAADVDAEYATRVKPQSSGGSSNTPVQVLNTEDHWGYIIGFPLDEVDPITGMTAVSEDLRLVMPLANISRAEVTTVFFRLLKDDVRTENWTQENSYSDVQKTNWFNNAVSIMSKMDIVYGYNDGTFRPNQDITRAEMAVFAARFARKMNMVGTVERSFSDIKGHWAQKDIEYAASVGWIAGYPDGTYGPDTCITRAEFMTMVNRMLGRIPETENDLHKDMIQWADNQNPSAWYYEAVQEATNSHNYTRTGKKVPDLDFEYEKWSEVLPIRDWAQFERAWSKANSAANPGGDVL